MKAALYGLAAAIALSLAIAALLALALPVLAEPAVSCGDTDQLLTGLDRQYGEKVAGQGVTLNGVLLRLLVGPETFTIVATLPEGVSCPILAGEDWQAVTPRDGSL